ncbi:MAG: hypothetical protein AB2385_09340 [Symbiobacterium sp.]|uniref:hypothetical protein n=1 Tax=Symbiobacterium sp. TaxID=1971213 RepID=UPI003464B520
MKTLRVRRTLLRILLIALVVVIGLALAGPRNAVSGNLAPGPQAGDGGNPPSAVGEDGDSRLASGRVVEIRDDGIVLESDTAVRTVRFEPDV